MAPALYYLNILDDYNTEELGHVFEALVGSQLVRTGEDLYYWRKGDYECFEKAPMEWPMTCITNDSNS